MPNSTSHHNALPSNYQLQEYRLQSILGHGGFGITYLAHDTELEALVAIKEYLPNELAVREFNSYCVQPKSAQDTNDFAWGLERFIQEARTLASFNHPNIVRVRRFFRANNTAYIVMDYEAGRSLAEILKEGETADETELMSLLPQLLDGLKAVHQAGYLHRDIKPGNICLRDRDNSPVLIDFGSARYDVGSRSRSVTTIVTPGYSPFEQYQRDGNQGPWTDIYALGAVLYRTIGGTTPIEANKRIDALLYNKPEPLKPAIEVGQSRYSQSLLKAIDWALKARETERPQTVTEWEMAILPQTPTLPSEPKSFVFERVALFAVVVMFLVAIGLVGYTQWQKRPNEQQHVAEQKRLEEQQRLAELQQQLEAAEKARPAEEQRLAELQRQQEAAEKARQAEEQRLAELQRQQEAAEKARQAEEQRFAIKWTPGNIIRDLLQDGSLGPEMVVIPAGHFQMGDIQRGGRKNEQPVHKVSVESLAMGRYELTKGEFQQFVNAADYQTDAEKGNSCVMYKNGSGYWMPDVNWRNVDFFQEDNHPVVCISWNDATAYTKWLSEQTGLQYRLPTEAEWEFAARAGSTSKYWWGNDIGTNKANCYKDCGDSFEHTAPIGSFEPNPFGLYDTAGNVWEYTCSEYEDEYTGKEQHCRESARKLVVRGAAWYSGAKRLRTANRGQDTPSGRSVYRGMRIVRQP